MASTSDPVFGGLKGRIGNLVVYQLYGKTVIRTLPSTTRKPAQGKLKESQDDFKAVVNILKRAKYLVQFGFAAQAVGRSAYHAALSENLKRYKASDDKSSAHWLMLSKGQREQAKNWQYELQENGQLQLNWENGTIPFNQSNDKLVVFMFHAEGTELASFEILPALRFQKTASFTWPSFYKGKKVQIFTAFTDFNYTSKASAKGISDSVWLGEIKS